MVLFFNVIKGYSNIHVHIHGCEMKNLKLNVGKTNKCVAPKVYVHCTCVYLHNPKYY